MRTGITDSERNFYHTVQRLNRYGIYYTALIGLSSAANLVALNLHNLGFLSSLVSLACDENIASVGQKVLLNEVSKLSIGCQLTSFAFAPLAVVSVGLLSAFMLMNYVGAVLHMRNDKTENSAEWPYFKTPLGSLYMLPLGGNAASALAAPFMLLQLLAASTLQTPVRQCIASALMASGCQMKSMLYWGSIFVAQAGATITGAGIFEALYQFGDKRHWFAPFLSKRLYPNLSDEAPFVDTSMMEPAGRS